MVKIRGREPGAETGEKLIKSIVNMVGLFSGLDCVACFNPSRGVSLHGQSQGDWCVAAAVSSQLLVNVTDLYC